MDEKQLDVWQVIEAVNRAWTVEGDASKLQDYFHPDMVAITASDRRRLDGRDACIASWASFMKLGQVSSWKIIDPQVKLFGDDRCAVASYYYEMTVSVNGKDFDLAGRDLFTLAREGERWWVISDHFSPYPRGGVE